MIPDRPLPCSEEFSTPEEYVEALLEFARTTDLYQILCGGVHILDFFTTEPGIFHAAIPEEWREFLLMYDIIKLIELFLTDDLDNIESANGHGPPQSLITYIKSLRRLSLRRGFSPREQKLPVLPKTVAVGMKLKKIHEVVNFADYVETLSEVMAKRTGNEISHFVDFGSGQNYLGRALASEPYNRHVVAVEGREINVTAARGYDLMSNLAIRPKMKRNKKMWNKAMESLTLEQQKDPEAVEAAIRKIEGTEAFEFQPMNVLDAQYVVEEGKGGVQYISGNLDSGDLSQVIESIETGKTEMAARTKHLRLMAVSIHSCGNLSHYGIQSLILNPDIRAVAIVGCCYNLMTERLGPPTYKHPYLRPTLQALNGRVFRESDKRDPQGFPMSRHFSTYNDDGVRLNITARMMACQAPSNWSREDSEGFFTRHFFRAVLQRIFLDRGVVNHIRHGRTGNDGEDSNSTSPFDTSTNPVIIGSLRKRCYGTFKDYVRGVVEKLTTSTEFKQYADVMREKMADISDEEIERYEREYQPRRKELSVIWTLMSLSASVTESLIVADRWMFLKEHQDVVKDAWVETVFDYGQSPRNLVVVGIKREDA